MFGRQIVFTALETANILAAVDDRAIDNCFFICQLNRLPWWKINIPEIDITSFSGA